MRIFTRPRLPWVHGVHREATDTATHYRAADRTRSSVVEPPWSGPRTRGRQALALQAPARPHSIGPGCHRLTALPASAPRHAFEPTAPQHRSSRDTPTASRQRRFPLDRRPRRAGENPGPPWLTDSARYHGRAPGRARGVGTGSASAGLSTRCAAGYGRQLACALGLAGDVRGCSWPAGHYRLRTDLSIVY